MTQRHDDPQFKFRMPSALKARLEIEARQNNRTLTAEILQRLEDSLAFKTPTLEAANHGKFTHITDQLNLLTSAILQEERMLQTMLDNPGLISPHPNEAAVEFQKMRIDTLRANYLSLIKEAELKVNPDNIFQLIWD